MIQYTIYEFWEDTIQSIRDRLKKKVDNQIDNQIGQWRGGGGIRINKVIDI